jgi:hypothetical protein
MSLRFRRRIKILPGVHLNISKSGISTSVGVRGASLTLGKRGNYVNTGIPGTGISWRSKLDSSPRSSTMAEATPAPTATPETQIRTHHLHWWKVLLFLITMVLAGVTKSDGIIGFFWIAWFGYWFFLVARLGYRRMKA